MSCGHRRRAYVYGPCSLLRLCLPSIAYTNKQEMASEAAGGAALAEPSHPVDDDGKPIEQIMTVRAWSIGALNPGMPPRSAYARCPAWMGVPPCMMT